MDRYTKFELELFETLNAPKVASSNYEDDAREFLNSLFKLAMEPIPVPPNETPEAVVIREQALALAQAQAERQHAEQAAMMLQQQAQQAQMEAQQASMAAQQQQQAAAQAQEESLRAVEAATAATENAAAQAVAKMNLSMRINQMRQQLAELASADPVGEEGLSFGEDPGAGAPKTTVQMQQEEEAAAAEEAASAQPAAAPTPGDAKRAQQEAEEAERAQARADLQAAQAQYEASKVSSDEWLSGVFSSFDKKKAREMSKIRGGVEQAFTTWPPKKGVNGPGGYAEQLINGGDKHPDVTKTPRPYKADDYVEAARSGPKATMVAPYRNLLDKFVRGRQED